MSNAAIVDDCRSGSGDAASSKLGGMTGLSPMRRMWIRKQIENMIAMGLNPAIEHVEPSRSADNYWYMWKLPMFGEKDIERILIEVEECRKTWPGHLVRLIGYDNDAQSVGASMVVHRPAG